jgi:hypothetical protein
VRSGSEPECLLDSLGNFIAVPFLEYLDSMGYGVDRVGFECLSVQTDFFPPKRPDRPRGTPSLLFNEYGRLSSG